MSLRGPVDQNVLHLRLKWTVNDLSRKQPLNIERRICLSHVELKKPSLSPTINAQFRAQQRKKEKYICIF